MTRDFLKSLELSDEAVNQVMAEYGKGINSLKAENDKYKAEIESLKTEMGKYSDYEEYKAYKSKYDDLQVKYDTDLENAKLNSIITEKLYQSKAKNVDLLKKSINLDKITKNESGDYSGIQEQINALKESDSYLFLSDKDTIPTVNTVGLGNDKPEPVTDPVTNAFREKFLKK